MAAADAKYKGRISIGGAKDGGSRCEIDGIMQGVWMKLHEHHLFPRDLERDYPLAVKGEGVWLWDGEGKKYLDGCSGANVTGIGHGVREIAEALAEQAARIAYVPPQHFLHEKVLEFSEMLIDMAPRGYSRVMLLSGGSEAMENAFKIARQFHVLMGSPSKYRIVSRWRGFHGNTLAADAAGGAFDHFRHAAFDPDPSRCRAIHPSLQDRGRLSREIVLRTCPPLPVDRQLFGQGGCLAVDQDTDAGRAGEGIGRHAIDDQPELAERVASPQPLVLRVRGAIQPAQQPAQILFAEIIHGSSKGGRRPG